MPENRWQTGEAPQEIAGAALGALVIVGGIWIVTQVAEMFGKKEKAAPKERWTGGETWMQE